MSRLTESAVWHALDTIKDPEIPVLSIVELGIVRSVSVNGDQAAVEAAINAVKNQAKAK